MSSVPEEALHQIAAELASLPDEAQRELMEAVIDDILNTVPASERDHGYWEVRGDAEARVGRWGDAEISFDEALRAGAPDRRRLLWSRAWILSEELGRPEEAWQIAAALTREDPDDIGARAVRAKSAALTDRWADADVSCTMVLAADTDNQDVRRIHAAVLLQRGRPKAAAAHAALMAPSRPAAAVAIYTECGNALAREKPGEAVKMFERAIGLAAPDADLLLTYGSTLVLAEKPQAALGVLQWAGWAGATSPKNELRLHAAMAAAHLMLGDAHAAEPHRRKLVDGGMLEDRGPFRTGGRGAAAPVPGEVVGPEQRRAAAPLTALVKRTEGHSGMNV